MLPTSTRTTVDAKLSAFLSELAELVGRAGECLAGDPIADDLTSQARALDRSFAELRDSAKPLTTGVAGVRRRTSVRRAVSVMGACDHYARGLARVSAAARGGAVSQELRQSAEQVKANISMLAGIGDGRPGPRLESADQRLDATREAVDRDPLPAPEHRRLIAAVGYLVSSTSPSSRLRTTSPMTWC